MRSRWEIVAVWSSRLSCAERAGLTAGSPVILVETPHGIVLMRRNQLRELVAPT